MRIAGKSEVGPRPSVVMIGSSGVRETSAASGDAVSLARELVRIPSVNPSLEEGGAGEREIAHASAAWLRGWGFRVEISEVAADRFNVVATSRSSSKGSGLTLLLNGHLDTVGVAGMTVPPFEGRIAGGRLVGRGACDMKGGVAALLAAAAAAARSGHGGTLIVALTADEEHASCGMEALVSSGLGADAAVVCEPTGLAVMPAHKGFVWLRALFHGRAAHGSRPELGVDAARHAALFVAGLEDLAVSLEQGAPHPLLGRPSFHVGTIRGGSAPSVYADRCEVVLERRTLPGESTASVEPEFASRLERFLASEPRADGSLEVTLARPGTEVPADSHLVRGLLNAARDQGNPPRVEGMSAWVDAAFLNDAGIPAVCYGPGSIAQAHSADEWAPVDEIERCVATLELFALTYLAGA